MNTKPRNASHRRCLKNEYEEAPVSATEVLEANVVSISATVARLETQIREMGAKLEADIRRNAEKAQSDLEKLAVRMDIQLQELRADYKVLREKADNSHERLLAKIGDTNRRIDATNDRIDQTNEKLGNLDRKVTDISLKLTALLWVIGGLGTLVTITVAVGKALGWF